MNLSIACGCAQCRLIMLALTAEICQGDKISTHFANLLAPALDRYLDRDSGALLALEHLLKFCPGGVISHAGGSKERVRNRLFIFHGVLLDQQSTLQPRLFQTDMKQRPGCQDRDR